MSQTRQPELSLAPLFRQTLLMKHLPLTALQPMGSLAGLHSWQPELSLTPLLTQVLLM